MSTKNESRKSQLKNALKKLSVLQRSLLILKLILWLMTYKVKGMFFHYLNAHSRSRVHWLGPKRPRRPERLFIVVVYAWAIVLLEAHQLLVWSVIWGALACAFVIGKSFAMIFHKKSDRWVIRY